jgi:TolB protein
MKPFKFSVLPWVAGLVLLVLIAGATAAGSTQKQWRILLSSDREGDVDIYSMNADGTGVRKLTSAPGFDGFAVSSPDGRAILYDSQDRRPGKAGAYLMNADGSGKRRTPGAGSWSPDGRKIVFSSDRDGNGEIYVVNVDGSGLNHLSRSPSSEERDPQWSPDGKHIAFVTDRDGNREIYVMNADGSDPRNLTHNAMRDGEDGQYGPLWSPDGRKILFTTNRDRTEEIYVMKADGSGQRRLTRTEGYDTPLTWSPDGRRIAFKTEGVKPRWAFLIMNADGSRVNKVNWALPNH